MPNWGAPGGVRWIDVALPDPEVTRMELAFSDTISLAVFRPGAYEEVPRYRLDLFGGVGGPLIIDATTEVSLDELRAAGGPIRLVAVATQPTDWTVDVACSTGPVLTQRTFPPVEVGGTIDIDLNVAEGENGHTYALAPEVPDGWSWDPSTGRLTGVPDQEANYPLEVTTTAPDGRSRTESVYVGAFEATSVACDETVARSFEGGAWQGIDPKGFAVFEVDSRGSHRRVGDDARGVGAGLPRRARGGTGSRTLGTADDRVLHAVVRAVERARGCPLLATTEHPRGAGRRLGHRLASGLDPADATLTVTCDTSPTLATHYLGLFEPGAASEQVLDVVGGTPPYTMSSFSLPTAITVTEDGRAIHDGSLPEGRYANGRVIIADADGVESTRIHSVWVGEGGACDGAPVLGCGDQLSGTIEGPYWEVANGRQEVCVSREAVASSSAITLTMTPVGGPTALGLLPKGPGHFATEDPREVGNLFSLVYSDLAQVRFDDQSPVRLADYGDLPSG